MKKFYLTTPIYYVNGRPHIGHVYTAIAADVVARSQRARGSDVLFSTGVDENSQKNVEAARGAGKDTQAYVDEMAVLWQETFRTIGLSHDVFIRTTSPQHSTAVKKVISLIESQGDIYLGDYQGKYCLGCEAFVAEKDLVDGLCPDHHTKPQMIKEKNYFFRLSKYRTALQEHFASHPSFLEPASARNKVLDYINNELADISISRQAQAWGIPLPQDPTHAVYVWFDALINYLTVTGYPSDQAKYKRYWPANLHLIGKDIIKFHAAIWPAMLLSAKLPLPERIFAHGFFTINGQKVSKSLGNAIDPLGLLPEYPIDSIRYYLLRDIPFGADGDFSSQRLHDRHNADLANGLGNLLARVLKMVETVAPSLTSSNAPTPSWAAGLQEKVTSAIDTLAFDKALQKIWEVIAQADQLVEKEKPWQHAQGPGQPHAQATLHTLLGALKEIGVALEPLLPGTSQRIKTSLATTPLRKPLEPLFIRHA